MKTPFSTTHVADAMSPATLARLKSQLVGWYTRRTWSDDTHIHVYRQRGVVPHPFANVLLVVMLLLLMVAIVWSHVAVLKEVTRGSGRVIPSRHVQVVQNLEGGIVEAILVKEGQVVSEGDVLLRIDDTGFTSSHESMRGQYFGLQAKISRLEAELDEREPFFSLELHAERPRMVANERKLYDVRQEELRNALSILKRQAQRESQQMDELKNRQENLTNNYKLLEKEVNLTRPLAKKDIVPQVDLLRLERELNETKGQVDATHFAIQKAQSAVREANDRINEKVSAFKAAVQAELVQARAEYDSLHEVMKASEAKVARTVVRSPVRGTVKKVWVSTVGGVIQPGMDLVEVVPLEDNLLVEARVSPQDIAFLRPNQEAVVKISAYDFSVYGGLDATLEHISADTMSDEKEGAYYLIRVRTRKSYLGRDEAPLPIIPGMLAQVDILTGEKSVWDYLMKPILKAREVALTER